jgi:hypothetical protein
LIYIQKKNQGRTCTTTAGLTRCKSITGTLKLVRKCARSSRRVHMVFLLCSSGVLIKTRGNVQGPLCACKNQKMKNEKKDKSGEMATLITVVCVCVCMCAWVRACVFMLCEMAIVYMHIYVLYMYCIIYIYNI